MSKNNRRIVLAIVIFSDSLRKYTEYAQELHESNAGTNIWVLKNSLYNRIKELGYTVTDGYQSLMADIDKWEYGDLFCVNISDFLKIKMSYAEYVTHQEELPFFMFLFPNVYDFIKELEGAEPVLKISQERIIKLLDLDNHFFG